jgi:hypothetical protein
MSLILSGTDGLSDVDGTAGTPAIRGTDANTGIFFPAADTIAFSEGGVESMRIDSSGNVGIGATSPASYANYKTLTIQAPSGGTGGEIDLKNPSGTTVGAIYSNSTDFVIASDFTNSIASSNLTFTTDGSERMRIDSSGNLLVGLTSARSNAGDVQVSKGISFPATQSAQSDANTLDDYEEGTWTPTNTEGITFSGISATYEKIGRTVIARARFIIATNSNANPINIGGLPFSNAAANSGAGGFFTYNASNVSGSIYVGTTTVTFYKDDGTAMVFSSFSNKDTQFTLVYYVS